MKTHRHLSPIELMIDEQLGLGRRSIVPIKIKLRCPRCRQQAELDAIEWFPDDTHRIELECPTCNPACDGRVIRFFNLAGEQIGGDP
jgi:hypothetical protein